MADPNIDNILSSYQSALAAGSLDTAQQIIGQALAAGVHPSQVYLQILQPALESVEAVAGSKGTSDPALRTAIYITERMLAMMARRFRPPPLRNGHKVALGCVLGEWQDVEMRMWRDFFQHAGWEVYPLGASLPPARLVALIERIQPDVLCLSAAHPARLFALQEAIEAVRARVQQVYILIGGAACRRDSELAHRIGADDYAANAAEALTTATRLVSQ